MYVIGDQRQDPVSESVSLAFLTFRIVVNTLLEEIKVWRIKLEVQVSLNLCPLR